MNFSEAMFYENYLTSEFHTNTVCLLVKMASKTVIRPINCNYGNCGFKALIISLIKPGYLQTCAYQEENKQMKTGLPFVISFC